MKILKFFQQKATFLYILTLLSSIVFVSFIDAGYTFYPVTLWAFTVIPLFVFWLLIPDKNWILIRTYSPAFIALFVGALFVFGSYFAPPYSAFGYKDLILFASMNFVVFTVATIPWAKVHLRFLFRILCAVAFLFTAYGIYRYIYFPFDRVIGPFLIDSGHVQQLFPNAFAFFLILIIPIQILYLFNQASSQQFTIRKLYFYISSVVIFAAFFLVFSRSSLIALLVMSIVFIFLQLTSAIKNKKFFRGRAIQSLLLIFLISFVSISFINLARSYNYDISDFEKHLDLDASENTTSFFDRFDYQEVGIRLSLEYPLFGIGTNNFQYFYPKYQAVPLLATNPHNFLVRIASETGLPSFLCAILFFGFVIYYYFREKNNIEQKFYVGSLGFALLASGIQNSIDYIIDFILNIVILGVFTALFISRFPVPKKTFSKYWKTFSIITVVLFLLVISVVSVHEFNANRWVAKAQDALAEKDYLAAAGYYETVSDKRWFKEDFQIKSANMYKMLSENRRLTGEEEKKWLESAEKAINISPHSDRSWNVYGEALYALGFYEKAYEVYGTALSIDPNNHLEYYGNLMLSKWKKGDLKQEDINKLKEHLAIYSELLKNNPYLLTNSDNHLHAENMYNYLINDIVPNDEEIKEMYTNFKNIFEEQKESVPEILSGGQERT